jgi:hypothetical protein
MRPAEIAPGEPSVCLPLCCDPNERRSNHRGHLTRWYHCDLRVQQGYTEILDQWVGLSRNQSAPCRGKFSLCLRREPEQFRKMDFAALNRIVRITLSMM